MTDEEAQEEAAYDAQDVWLNRHGLGNRPINQSWFVDRDILGSKIYGHGVLTTNIVTLEHEFDPFDRSYGK